MTNAELIAKIKAEIERLKEQLIRGACAAQVSFETSCKDEAYNELLSFLDTLESEKPINLDDAMKELDEKIALVKRSGTWDRVDVDKYMDEVRGREPEKPVPADLEEAAEKYSKERAEGYVLYDWVHAFIAGAKWDRSKMMEDAVEGIVYENKYIRWVEADVTNQDGVICGDKVRVIVCKKED